MYPIWAVYLFILLSITVSTLDTATFLTTIHADREKKQLEYAINAASDASVEEMLDTMKAEANNSIVLDPNFIWKVYKYTFLRSNDLYSEGMMETLEASFPSVVIAVNDGFFMRLATDNTIDGKTQKVYRFTQKIPYARTTTDLTLLGDSPNGATGLPEGTVVADTLDGKNIWVHDMGTDGEYAVVQASSPALPSKAGTAHDLTDINRMLLNAIEYSMFYNSNKSATDAVDSAMLSIPDEVSQDLLSPSVNFIGPTVFAFSDTINLLGDTYKNYYSVGASQIVKATNYYTYVRDGKKYYSRRNPETFGITTIDGIYTRPTQAATYGYRPDPTYY